MRSFTADFETTTDEDDCRVWAYAISEIGNTDNFIYGNNIDDFIKFCSNDKENYTLYFHNLKFDGEFIFQYLIRNGFKYIEDRKLKDDKTFSCLISDMGQFYSIEIFFKVQKSKINKVTIYDSLKILNFSVSEIAKEFNLPISKLEIDYKEKREIGHILTDQEINYIHNDVEIVAQALKVLFDENLKQMTQGSNALHNYKDLLGNSKFEHYYPILDYQIDKDIRQSYKGGFTYLNPIYKEKDVQNGIVLDVNSLYPSVMHNELLPFGNPIKFENKYEPDSLYSLYVQMISCQFKLKENKIPTIQLKHNLTFMPNQYIEDSQDIVALCLTNIDLQLFFDQYDVTDLEYHGGWKFRAIVGLFSDYVDKWSKRKIESKKAGNKAMYKLSKLMLNSLYGKFALNPDVQGKFPELTENGIMKYKLGKPEIRNSIYIPMGTFITSYARNKTIRTSQAIKDYSLKNYGKDLYIYSDTDSIHTLLPIEECKKFCKIDDYILGYWKHESSFSKARFLRQKCYIEEINNNLNIVCAGLPKNCYENVTFDNFQTGFTCSGKLTFKHVPGGVVLVETDFTIKQDEIR